MESPRHQAPRRAARRFLLMLAAVILVLPLGPPAAGRVGLAEWEVETPGGHLVSHADPWVEQYGTCLRRRGTENNPGILVAHLDWWQYYPDHVAGKARDGYFVLHEPTHALIMHASEVALEAALRQRGAGAPVSPRFTPADGWRQTWRPVFESRCRQLQTGGPAVGGLSPAEVQAVRDLCRQLGLP
jgi:hypothetical protein